MSLMQWCLQGVPVMAMGSEVLDIFGGFRTQLKK